LLLGYAHLSEDQIESGIKTLALSTRALRRPSD